MPGITRIAHRIQERLHLIRSTTVKPSGFLKSEAILATSLFGPRPTGARERHSLDDLALHDQRALGGVVEAPQRREVQVRLVHAGLLEGVGALGQESISRAETSR